MNEPDDPIVHLHMWDDRIEDEPTHEVDLKWTGTYDDHVQFSGPGEFGHNHIEIRVFFRDIAFLCDQYIEQRIRNYVREND